MTQTLSERRTMHPSRLRRPTPAGFFWIGYAAMVVLAIWVLA